MKVTDVKTLKMNHESSPKNDSLWLMDRKLLFEVIELPSNVLSGDSCLIRMCFTDYEYNAFDALKVDLVNEDVCWFEDYENKSLIISLK